MADTPFKTTDRDGNNVSLPTAQAVVDAIVLLMAAVNAPSTARPISTGAATDAKLEAVRALLAAALTVNLPTGAATAALQATLNTLTGYAAPADDVLVVAPSDTVDLATVPKALLVIAAGTLAIKGAGGTTVSLGTVSAGAILPIRARRVMATGTTATVVGLV